MTPVRVVFMGTPDFAAIILKSLIDSEYEVAAVFTQTDKPVGRKAILTPPPVKELALSQGIPVFQPQRLRDEEWVSKLRELQPDVIVVAAYGKIIPQSILDIPSMGCINVHASLLPAYRGAAPIQWALINGEQVTGVTIMRMDAGLDTGDMISRRAVEITPEDTGETLFRKLSEISGPLLIETLDQIRAGSAVYEKQPEQSPTPYASMLGKKDGLIDWTGEAAEIERRIRAFTPWPGAWTYFRGKTMKIWEAQVLDCGGREAGTEAGIVKNASAEGIDVQTGDGILRILSLQAEGKKKMKAGDYLRGNPAAVGMKLG